jgi:gliding motility-associated-like protein
MKKGYLILFFLSLIVTGVKAQKGKNGPLVVSTATVVNEYTSLTVNASSGNTTIHVANSGLNQNSRFSANLNTGDLVMIIQVQGATIKGHDSTVTNLGTPDDSTWGSVLNYNNCGNYEFKQVQSVPNDTTIVLSCALINNYTDTGRVEVVRVPRYTTLTVNNGGSISCDVWDSIVGGIVAIEVQNNTIINTGGSIIASASGFRGGILHNQPTVLTGLSYEASNIAAAYGALKGEGIAGNWTDYKHYYGGGAGRGAPANGGGGADDENAAGGGGSNGGVLADWVDGFGVPDVSSSNYITAWNLEFTWMSSIKRSGGGRGGYTWTGGTPNPLIDGPGNAAWLGDDRRSVGGRGGRPLDYTTGKIFMGGGGGAGQENNDNGGGGGAGGGIIYLLSYGTVSGGGQIISNGANGQNDIAAPSGDGAGGAGAGGTIIISSAGNISGVSLQANGGVGGSQIISTSETEGGAGGGGGGYIAASNGGIPFVVNGGANGTTNSVTMVLFPPDGATSGNVGTVDSTFGPVYDNCCSLTAINISSTKDTICAGDTATIFVTYSDINQVTYSWSPGGQTTDTIHVKPDSTTTYYVTVTDTNSIGCVMRDSITIAVNPLPKLILTGDTIICKGETDTLHVSGGTSYKWSTGVTTSSIFINPPVTTTYTVTVYGKCDSLKKAIAVTVVPLPIPIITGSANKCNGIADTLTVSGGTTYKWSNGSTTTNYFTGGIMGDSTITVIAYNSLGCPGTAQFTISVTPSPSVTVTYTNTCLNNPVVIKAYALGTGPFTYSWSPGGQTSDSIIVPDTVKSYTVTVSNGCKFSKTIKLIPDIPFMSACCDKLILSGDDTTIVAGGDSIKSYSWSPVINCLNPPLCDSVKVNPTVTTTYTVTGTDAEGCTISRVVTISVEEPCFNFTVPNVFTPNDGGALGLNKIFYIKTENLTNWAITIYDRWGKEMFNSSNPLEYWTGTTEGGENAPDGVYYYIISATCQGNTYKKEGFVQLIR